MRTENAGPTNIVDPREFGIRLEQLANARTRIVVDREDLFMPVSTWETGYPRDLLEHVLKVKGPAYLCDEIMRDEDPTYVEHFFRWDILSFVDEKAFAHKRVLDFGMGSGASSMVLARMLPQAEIVGTELVGEFVELARHRAKFYGVEDRVRFYVSPSPAELPAGIGPFDYIVFSAVYEHLLPQERTLLLPIIWSHLKPGGLMFLDQTPHRWFPVETHTTGLPLINYMPPALALLFVRAFSRRMNPAESWTDLLRKGIRGGTPREILRILNGTGSRAELVVPNRLGIRDEIDLWYRVSVDSGSARIKKLLDRCLRWVKAATGISLVPILSLAIRKVG